MSPSRAGACGRSSRRGSACSRSGRTAPPGRGQGPGGLDQGERGPPRPGRRSRVAGKPRRRLPARWPTSPRCSRTSPSTSDVVTVTRTLRPVPDAFRPTPAFGGIGRRVLATPPACRVTRLAPSGFAPMPRKALTCPTSQPSSGVSATCSSASSTGSSASTCCSPPAGPGSCDGHPRWRTLVSQLRVLELQRAGAAERVARAVGRSGAPAWSELAARGAAALDRRPARASRGPARPRPANSRRSRRPTGA